jgi:ABC-type multidrug transport system fused ATPase/permease subunit
MFRRESHKRTDRYTSAARTFHVLNKWIAMRMDTLGLLFILALTTYLIYGGGRSKTPSEIGFSINMAFSFSMIILWLMFNIIEVQSTSILLDILTRAHNNRISSRE